MKTILKTCICLSFFGHAAAAATVGGSFSGTISAPYDVESDIEYTGAGTNVLRWGLPSPDATSVEDGNSSMLSVDNNSFLATGLESGDSFLIGTITWNNQSNWDTGSRWTSDIDLTLSFSDPEASGPYYDSITFSIYNTTDESYNTDTNEATGLNPDWISGIKLGSDFGVPLSLGDGVTLTSITFGLEDAGTAGTHASFGGYGSGLFDVSHDSDDYQNWVNREGGTSVLGIYGHVKVAAVPLPAGALLLLSGLGAFAAARRRKAKAG